MNKNVCGVYSMFDVSKYCLPAKIYLVISLFAVVFGAFSEFSVVSVVFHVCVIVLWTLLLNWLCASDLAVLSWVLVLFPYILVSLAFIGGELWFRKASDHDDADHDDADHDDADHDADYDDDDVADWDVPGSSRADASVLRYSSVLHK